MVLAVVAAWFALGCTGDKKTDLQNASTFTPAAEEEKVPDFTLPDVAGRAINLRSYEGKKIVVLNIWATWCGPCRHEIPDFNAAYETYKDRGVEFIGLSVDQNAEEVVPPFMEKLPIAYPVVLGSPELGFRYGARGIPTTFIIDKSGRVQRRFVGMINRQILAQELQKLL
jgi:cytochrome c biogenesis protein CcmG/thiol:disulfide interchange protein DsbE